MRVRCLVDQATGLEGLARGSSAAEGRVGGSWAVRQAQRAQTAQSQRRRRVLPRSFWRPHLGLRRHAAACKCLEGFASRHPGAFVRKTLGALLETLPRPAVVQPDCDQSEDRPHLQRRSGHPDALLLKLTQKSSPGCPWTRWSEESLAEVLSCVTTHLSRKRQGSTPLLRFLVSGCLAGRHLFHHLQIRCFI